MPPKKRKREKNMLCECFNQTLNKYIPHENKLRKKYKPQRLLRECKSSISTIAGMDSPYLLTPGPPQKRNFYPKNFLYLPTPPPKNNNNNNKKKTKQFFKQKNYSKNSIHLPNKPIFKTKKLFIPVCKNQAPGPFTLPTQKK